MPSGSDSIFKQPDKLRRLLLAAMHAPDTPALIQMVAADSRYLDVCSVVCAPDSDRRWPIEFAVIQTICRQGGINFALLRERLTPVAYMLGAVGSGEADDFDPYSILGVSSHASDKEIHRAYRKKALETHPDRLRGAETGSDDFIELQSAYETLKIPEARRRYDRHRRATGRWVEQRMPTPPKPPGHARWFFLLGGLLSVFIAITYSLDLFFTQSIPVDSYYRTSSPSLLPVDSAPSTHEVPDPSDGEPLDITEKPKLAANDARIPTAPVKAASASPPVAVPGAGEETAASTEPSKQAAYAVHVYFTDEADREILKRLAGELDSTRFDFAHLQRVDARSNPSVRFFHDADRYGAEQICSAVSQFLDRAVGRDDLELALSNLSAVYRSVPEGLIELWVGPLSSRIPESQSGNPDMSLPDDLNTDSTATRLAVADARACPSEPHGALTEADKSIDRKTDSLHHANAENELSGALPEIENKERKQIEHAVDHQMLSLAVPDSTILLPGVRKPIPPSDDNCAHAATALSLPAASTVAHTIGTQPQESDRSGPSTPFSWKSDRVPSEHDGTGAGLNTSAGSGSTHIIASQQPLSYDQDWIDGRNELLIGNERLKKRLQAFLDHYCEIYESKNLDAFSTFFAPGAVENGVSFAELRPQYNKTFNQFKWLTFSITLADWSQMGPHITLNGTYVARGRLKGTIRKRQSRGHIEMDLIECESSTFLVKRLEYEMDELTALWW